MVTIYQKQSLFYYGCQYGLLDNIIIILREPNSHITNNLNINLGFRYACVSNKLTTAIYLFNYAEKYNIEIDISYQYEYIIRKVIEQNYYNVAEWILSNFKNINVSVLGDNCLFIAYKNNNLKIIQLLLEYNPELNLYCYDNLLFRLSYINGKYEIMRFLLKKHPSLATFFKNNFKNDYRLIVFIQRTWLETYMSPYTKLGKNRLEKQYNQLISN